MVHEYQPTDKDGRPIGGLQRFKYRTSEELIDKLNKEGRGGEPDTGDKRPHVYNVTVNSTGRSGDAAGGKEDGKEGDEPSYEKGTSYVPKTGPALLHEGEGAESAPPAGAAQMTAAPSPAAPPAAGAAPTPGM